MTETIPGLQDFIVRAKAATYIGSGRESPACRTGSHDLEFREGAFHYLDSYFGAADFIGEEVVYLDGKPVWGMNYCGRLLEPDRITAAETGTILKKSLAVLYLQNRFLGGFEHREGEDAYFDTNTGDLASFTGLEWIERQGLRVYELVYHGGLIR